MASPTQSFALTKIQPPRAPVPSAVSIENAQDMRAPATAAPRAVGSPVLVTAEALSPRQLEVLALITAGDSIKLIARAFDLSPPTVKRHVANILDKLGVQSRGQAAAWYSERRPGPGIGGSA